MSSADSLILIVAVAIFGFALVLFLPIIPYIYKEAYDVPVIHEEQEQYIEKTPYTVEATVTKTQQLYTHSTKLGAITFEYKDVTIPSAQNMKITWASSTKIVLFSVMTNSAWDSFYRNLMLTMGLPAVATLLSGGTLTIPTAGAAFLVVVNNLPILSRDNYYVRGRSGETVHKHMKPGTYKVVVVGINASGSLKANLSYDYQTTEQQIQYRDEVRIRAVQKTRMETKYRDAKKTTTLFKLLTGHP